MIDLSNVSKYYYKKGMIASGITRVNLHLDAGEFVVITGESGSGKSTLLNVISGMDTYEEGEMYIEDRPTSHFMEKDFAEYRKRYIGNVFQNYNLVNSYTVYQNVELVLLINGFRRKYIKQRVSEILARVGMTDHAHVKASKLSGGQKQRVAIARALAKETSIIVADEPTGNLDSESAAGIVQLLSEIAGEKLVIVVTHNFDQFRDHATRKITMHDGKIAEDVRLGRRKAPVKAEQETEELQTRRSGRSVQTGKISGGSKLRLGIRNTFNVVPKFLLLFLVFVFLLTAVTSQYTTYLAQKEEAAKLGMNSYFTNLRLDRLVLKKNDGSMFTGGDFDAISSIYNVKSIAEYDVLVDNPLYLECEEFDYMAIPKSLEGAKLDLIAGRMPEANNEVVLATTSDDPAFHGDSRDKNLDKIYTVDLGSSGEKAELKVVGLAWQKEEEAGDSGYSDVYMSTAMMDRLLTEIYHDHSELVVEINGKEQVVSPGDVFYNVRKSAKVAKGEAVVSVEVNNYYNDGKCKGKDIKIRSSNIYFKKAKTLKIKDTYSEKNFTAITGHKHFETYDGVVFLNEADYNELFAGNNYQVTVYVEDTDKIDETKAALEETGYITLPLKDTLLPILSDVLQLIRLPIAIIVILALFFITYFVIRLILRSRAGYFSILRMLGMDKKAIRRITDVELLLVMTLAFAIFMVAALLSGNGIIDAEYVQRLVKHMRPENYGILYGVMLVMSYLISGKFTKSLFRKSAMGTYREEV